MEKAHLKEGTSHGTPDFPVAIYHNTFTSQENLLAPLHYHNEFELLVASKGTLCVQMEEELYTLSEGEGLFINSGLLHIISADEAAEHGFIAIVFDMAMLCTEHDLLFHKYMQPLLNRTLTVPVKLTPEICTLVRTVCTNYEASAYGFELYTKQALIQIFYLLIKDSKTTSLPLQSNKSLLIKNTLDYIENNYAEPISLQDMADSIHISKEYLCRIFHMMSDASPVEYLNRYRIKQSTALLLYTNRGISDISLSCGFNSSSYFNKLFLRYMGCTPSEYRRNNTYIDIKN